MQSAPLPTHNDVEVKIDTEQHRLSFNSGFDIENNLSFESSSDIENHISSESGSDTGDRISDSRDENNLSDVEERKLMRKVDLRLIPILCILYLLAFLDRVNIANAREFGLLEDLGLKGKEYNTSLTIFFIPYIIFELPSNILLKKFRPNVWLSSLMFLFGVTTIFLGLVQNYSGLLATRFFLGLFESGMVPGCSYLIGMWYKPSEAQLRFTFFFCSTSLAGVFGGLLASAIGKMDGVGGYKGWRWIFILEGIVTCLAASLILSFTPPFPEDAMWLTNQEKLFVKKRQESEQGSLPSEDRITLLKIGRVFRQPRVFIGGLMSIGMGTPAYCYAYFAPAIIKTFNYSPIQTQLHTVAPWTCAFIFSVLLAYLSDLTKHRFIFSIAPIGLSLTGYAIELTVHDNINLKYASLFLIVMGLSSIGPIIICWYTMNLNGHLERSVGTAWQIGFGNIGAIIGTYSFLPNEAPYYTRGYSICVGFLCFTILSCSLYAAIITWENKRISRAMHDSESNEKPIRKKEYLL